MAEPSPETNDAIAAVSTQTVNGASGVPPFVDPAADHPTLVAADEATEAAIIPFAQRPEDDGTRDRTQDEHAPQVADGSRRQGLNGAVRPTAAAQEAESLGREVRVADIRKNKQDARGEKIDFVFFRRRNCFAIYKSSGRIMVQYADDEAEAKEQVANIAELLPLRDRLNYIVNDMKSPHAYQWQIAESLRLGLDGQKDAAKGTMQAAIDNIIATRVSDGRTAYLVYAGMLVVGAVVLLGITAATLWYAGQPTPEGLGYLMLATGSGAMGAMLSTAIALRARTVATDVDWKSNSVDGAMRIMIGLISAAVLYLILDSDVLAGFSLSTRNLTYDAIWKIALLIGFLAGFLERLVPDLLENKLASAMVK